MSDSKQQVGPKSVTHAQSTKAIIQTRTPDTTLSFHFVEFTIRLDENFVYKPFGPRGGFRLNACVPSC